MDKKLEELADDENSYDDQDEESDQDLDSELGDTLDVNDMKYHPNLDREEKSSGDETPAASKANQNQNAQIISG